MNKSTTPRTTLCSKERRRAALCGIWIHDTLPPRQAPYQLSYQGNSAGRGFILQHYTTQRHPQTTVLWASKLSLSTQCYHFHERHTTKSKDKAIPPGPYHAQHITLCCSRWEIDGQGDAGKPHDWEHASIHLCAHWKLCCQSAGFERMLLP